MTNKILISILYKSLGFSAYFLFFFFGQICCIAIYTIWLYMLFPVCLYYSNNCLLSISFSNAEFDEVPSINYSWLLP